MGLSSALFPSLLLPYLEASRQALGIFSADNQSPGQVSALGELTEQREGMIRRDLPVLYREGSQHPIL